jgi:TRAP-type uncharacterized transport system fused permease subunit
MAIYIAVVIVIPALMYYIKIIVPVRKELNCENDWSDITIDDLVN